MQVSTEKDPASARLGETLYAFVPRSIVGNIQDGVASELERLRSRRLPVFSLHNRRGYNPLNERDLYRHTHFRVSAS